MMTNHHDVIVAKLTKTLEKIKEVHLNHNDGQNSNNKAHPDHAVDVVVTKLPSTEESVGVDSSFIQLCATIAGGVYSVNHKKPFQQFLDKSIPDDKKKYFPDLEVQVYQTGVKLPGIENSKFSSNPPSFTMVTTGDTLILGWRGTVSFKDMLADMDLDSISLAHDLVGLEVQKAYYKLITRAYFRSHQHDITAMVENTYKKPNGKGLPGGPIRRIYLTGHSLGGGLAQVAHLCLRAPIAPYKKLAEILDDNGVEIKTIAISAPMTTVLVEPNPSAEAATFLREKIEPDMCNIFYNADIVPRGYSELHFINGFIESLLHDESSIGGKGVVNALTIKIIGFVSNCFTKNKAMLKQAEQYRHVGKLIYYADAGAAPVTYFDPGFFREDSETRQTASGDAMPSFRDLEYDGPVEGVIGYALGNHMALVDTGIMFAVDDNKSNE